MKNNKKTFNVTAAKKLISDYGDKIVLYMKENQHLTNQVRDLKTTLSINKEMLYSNLHIKMPSCTQIISNFKQENDRISELYLVSTHDKLQLEKKIYMIQQELNDKSIQYQELEDKWKESAFQLENQLEERNNIIKQLKKELFKYYKEDFNSTKELIICDPDKVNLEMNNELCEARELITKYCSLIQQQKKQMKLSNNKINVLKEMINNKSKGKRVVRNIENIEQFGYLLSLNSNSDIDSSSDRHYSYNRNCDDLSLDSPVGVFPEKIKMTKTLNTETQEEVPKLDLSKVLKKYQPLKVNEIVEGKKCDTKQYENDEYIEKLKFQLKIEKGTIIKYRTKITEMKKVIGMLKQHLLNQQRNQAGSLGSTTDDNNLNKIKDFQNDSMNNNISMALDDDEIIVEEEFDFVDKINKTMITTTTEHNV